jgi:serine/threonine protein kinase
MPIQSGSKLGPYEILAPLGAGGMGEVYRARDPRIGRDVAVKLLPSAYSADPERLRRFELEARATGVLNHPNILAIHDLGTQDGSPYIVSELLEGETLRDKLRIGPVPLRKTIEYALQLAHGLAAAHDKGIAHRDLKPENIFVTKDGRLKILDFGLAKLIQPETANEEVSRLQTGSPESQPGMVLGTIGYMSPEQVRGRPSDHRSDIFAFGAILYEMLSGKRAFQADTAADTMGAILQKDPLEASGAGTLPPGINRLIRHCLEKTPEERFQSMRDVAFDVETLTGISETQATSPATPLSRRALPGWLQPMAIVALAALTVLFATGYFARAPKAAPVIRFSLNVPKAPASTDNTVISTLQMALSPDGNQLVFASPYTGQQNILWIRPLDSINAKPLLGTEGAFYPFWSPDSRFIGFFTTGKLKKIDVQSGSIQTICDAPTGRGGTWSPDGTILLAPDKLGAIVQVSSEGGEIKAVTDDPAQRGISYRWPEFLPDYDHFLYLSQYSGSGYDGVFLSSLHSKDSRLVSKVNSRVAFLLPGYLLFYRDGKLMGLKFDWKRGAVSGDAFAIAPETVSYNAGRGFPGFSASETGVLSYQPDTVTPSPLVWLDRTGKQVDTAGELDFYTCPRISPDGKRIAVVRHGTHSEEGDIWLYDTERSSMTRFTLNPAAYTDLAWSNDGNKIFFSDIDLFQKPSNGAGNQTLLFKSPIGKVPTDVSPDGKFLAMNLDNAKTQQDLWIFPLSVESKPFPLLQETYNENSGQFSPDNRWIAYASDESGKTEIYVRPFPAKDAGKWQVSNSGGILPRWRRDGKELFYISTDKNMMMAVDIKPGATFESAPPRPLFEMPLITLPDDTLYDVTPDGQRFIVSSPPGRQYPSTINVVVNWMGDLKN